MKKKTAIIIFIIFIIDRITKIYIVNNYQLYIPNKIINNFLYITRTENTGAAFSIFTDQTIYLILITIVMIGIIGVMIYKEKKYTIYKMITYGILIGGVLGNFIDRILYKHVIDFIDIYIFNYNFPIFNIADIAIVTGTILLLIDIIIKGENNENNR